MTKAELIGALEQYPDDATIVVWAQGMGELELLRVAYHGGEPVFVHLVARVTVPTGDKP